MAWQIDPAHSTVQFSVRHMMVSKVRGRFERFTGTVDADETHVPNSRVDVQIEAASINTGDAQRDAHLRSPDFLNAEAYPYITFVSTDIQHDGAENGTIAGNLTIRDVTRPVVLKVEYAGQGRNPWGATVAGFSATTKINRKDFGLEWNVALETGGFLVGDEITVEIELELTKQAGQPAAEAEAAVAA
jgi:polyisoprenoid-binding protein YceI